MVKKVLTIAGSDSGGGAGIQADLKTFAALGTYGTSAVTAVTAQNTLGVQDWLALPARLVAAQIHAVLEDIGADAIKTGMLANADIIRVVADTLRQYDVPFLVVDPVLAAKSGDPLVEADAVAAYKDWLFPLATVVTPNLPEATRLLGHEITTEEDMRRAAQELVALGCRAALVKGGHRTGAATDILYDGTEYHVVTSERVATKNDHGTGCTLASGIAALLARGFELPRAVAEAKKYVTGALRYSYAVGKGHGPVHHFWHIAGLCEYPDRD